MWYVLQLKFSEGRYCWIYWKNVSWGPKSIKKMEMSRKQQKKQNAVGPAMACYLQPVWGKRVSGCCWTSDSILPVTSLGQACLWMLLDQWWHTACHQSGAIMSLAKIGLALYNLTSQEHLASMKQCKCCSSGWPGGSRQQDTDFGPHSWASNSSCSRCLHMHHIKMECYQIFCFVVLVVKTRTLHVRKTFYLWATSVPRHPGISKSQFHFLEIWGWWRIPRIQALGRQKQKDQEYTVILG